MCHLTRYSTVLATLLFFAGDSCRGQGAAPGVPAYPVTGVPDAGTTPPGLPPADAPEQESGNWLMRSSMVDVGWPEIKMPKVNWKPWGAAEDGGEPKPGPLARMTTATQNAFLRGRTAWNSTIDKMKVGPFRPDAEPTVEPDAQPGFFARMFGGGQEPEGSETVAEFIGQDRPEFR